MMGRTLMDHNTPQGPKGQSLRATLRPMVPALVAGGLAGLSWGVVWPIMRMTGAADAFDWQAWFAAAVAFVFISVALGDLIASFITPDTPERMDEDDLYEFREQAGIRRAFAYLWGALGLTLVSVLACSQEYGSGNTSGVMLVNALVLNSTFAIGYLQKNLDEYWKSQHAKTLQTAFVVAMFLLGFWSVWANAGYDIMPKPAGVLAGLGASYLIAWAAIAWHRNRPSVEGYAPGR